MNHSISKSIVIFGALLLCPMYLSAHEGSGILGKSASATHYYQIDCGTGSAHLYVEVKSKGTATAPIVSAQLSKDSFAMSTTDPKNTDALPSRGLQLDAGDGGYHVTISKSKPGIAKYAFQYHCKNSNGEHTETERKNIEYKR
ncbi:MAG: hypothetical protein ABL925_08905 [Methylococcales bacterium]